MKNRKYLAVLIVLLLASLAADFNQDITDTVDKKLDSPSDKIGENISEDEKIDDWQFSQDQIDIRRRGPRNVSKDDSGYPARYLSGMLYGHTYKSMVTPATANPISAIGSMIFLAQGTVSNFGATSQSLEAQKSLQRSGDIGLKTGGAQDINNFRDNINNGYLPLTKDISYEGLLHEYYFDTGQKEECEQLFCPSYSKAVTNDPLSNQTEYYTTVGLNSELTRQDFRRKKLNLVVVMDISGSMGSSFDRYYYDRYGNQHEVENYTDKKKMKIAKESLRGLTGHLRPEDRFGVVLFNSDSYKAKPLNKVARTDMDAIRKHIKEDISEGGGTNMEAGMEKASDMLEQYRDVNQSEYENRIIFMTDAMPNIGTTSDQGLMDIAEENSDDNIHTTFVGMGVDFNTDLVDSITSIKGANYYSVHSSKQFKNRMDKYFEFMVTPLVYDLKLELDSDSYSIEKVYGSTAAEESTGQILKVNTLFPSPREGGQTKGGVVLAQLEKTGTSEEVELKVDYTKRNGEQKTVTDRIEFENLQPENFENSGIRKAVLLTRYADLMKNWIEYERDDLEDEPRSQLPPRYREDGIEPYPVSPTFGEQERTSEDLQVSASYEERIKIFKTYLEKEADRIGDSDLDQEIDMMNQILQKD